ncbi:hypothetical protein H2204_004704 [Knufia peltigerae]|uniref:Ketopantoate reductase N-terminal domain-containing protein n=1 Tax=Knufia peltigerae TaxID=1002370 RepID=A0AA38Y799_9EURO|nr:hypothetical protein H2204_004704 [Knufia peltigerae]
MSHQSNPRVLIVGAGSMGLVCGYILSEAKAEITFLVRPHRVKDLSPPRRLYCFNDHKLKTFQAYQVATDPEHMIDAQYDFILITLDTHALMNEVGTELVKVIGKAVCGSRTMVVIGSVSFDIRPWFLETSQIPSEQVANGMTLVHAYAPSVVKLPIHEGTDRKLLQEADQGYVDSLGAGFIISDSAPVVAEKFSALYNSSTLSSCAVYPAEKYLLFSASLFPVFPAYELLGWPDYDAIDPEGEIWRVCISAMKEIQRLSIMGVMGEGAAESTSGVGVIQQFSGMAKAMFPFPLVEFYKYHHGGKVVTQDRELMEICVSYGKAEGKQMSALRELLRRTQ